jgi:hypothetical protein
MVLGKLAKALGVEVEELVRIPAKGRNR